MLRTTRNFRSVREVEELWEEAIRRVNEGVKDALKTESDPELFIAVKECLLGFSMTMEVSNSCLFQRTIVYSSDPTELRVLC